jgi:hypothetical protein
MAISAGSSRFKTDRCFIVLMVTDSDNNKMFSPKKQGSEMEPSQRAGLVHPSEWILLLFAAVLLGAAVSDQSDPDRPPVQAAVTPALDATSLAETAAAISSNASTSPVLLGSPVLTETGVNASVSLITPVDASSAGDDDTKLAAVTRIETGIATDGEKNTIDTTN